jgi:hypothetical protein
MTDTTETIAYEPGSPRPGDLVLGCKHEPDPWDGRESVECFRFRRPVSFFGLASAHRVQRGRGELRGIQWFLACPTCAAEVRKAAKETRHVAVRVMEAIADCAGVSGRWPEGAPPLRLVQRDTRGDVDAVDLVGQLLAEIRRTESGS